MKSTPLDDERRALVVEYRNYAYSTAHRLGGPLCFRDEMEADALAALVQCAVDWDPQRMPDFRQYLNFTLRRRLVDALRLKLGRFDSQGDYRKLRPLHLEGPWGQGLAGGPWGPGDVPQPADRSPGPEAEVVAHDELERMWAAVEHLADPRDRRLVYLRFKQEMSQAAVARLWHVDPSRICQMERVILAQLRSALREPVAA